jgi:hypothetical protein
VLAPPLSLSLLTWRPGLTEQGDDALVRPVVGGRPRTPPTPLSLCIGTVGLDNGRLQPWRRTGVRGLHGRVVVMQEAGSMAEFPNVSGLHALWL